MIETYRYAVIFKGDESRFTLDNCLIKPIIKSDVVNHELASSLFTKNYNDDVVVGGQMAYGHLNYDMVSLLSKLGTFQFGCDLEAEQLSNIDEVEFFSLLETIEVISVNLEDIFDINSTYGTHKTKIAFCDDYPTNIDDLDWQTFSIPYDSTAQNVKLNALLLVVSSSDIVNNLSQEIHNKAVTPHQNFNDLVLFKKDLGKYNTVLFLNEDLIEVKSNIKIGDTIKSELNDYYSKLGISIYDEYAECLDKESASSDKIGNYIFEVNGKLVCRKSL